MREEVSKSALKALDEAKIRCDIPSLHSFLYEKKTLSMTMEFF